MNSQSLKSETDHCAKEETDTAHCQREPNPGWQATKTTDDRRDGKT
ncbi:MAG TPA: hypothetical protein VNW72_13020 [Chthoniobacterales bacterium]|nr:hypothetical protein [Chthoniobacterales bacterium]